MKPLILISLLSTLFIGTINAQRTIKGKTQPPKEACIQNICFTKKPKLIFSRLDYNDYSGLRVKVYSLILKDNKIESLDSLIKKGYSRLPFKTTDMNEIPYYLKKYMEWYDKGFYLYNKKEDNDKFVIINTSRKELILYEFGFFEDLFMSDSLHLKMHS